MTHTGTSIGTGAHAGFEERLVEQLQPIRGFVLASSLYHFFELKLADAVLGNPPVKVSDLARRFDLDLDRLRGLLLFLQVEGFVRLDGDDVEPLGKLTEVREAWPWYEMLIGGYAQTYLDMGKGLRAGSGALTRNGERVGSGSCKISHYDAIPLTKSLLDRLEDPPKKIIDLGCGNALYLKELCSLYPDLVAIGVEPDEGSHAHATEDIQQGEFDARIRLYRSTAQDFVASTKERDADVLIIAFVLQEILGQDGRQGVARFLKHLRSKFADSYIIVIEVDNKADDLTAMKHPLAHSYYNPYYLAHYFTDQVLEGPAFWLSLFEEVGLGLVAQDTTNPDVDSTGLEIGFLLKSV